MAGSGAIGPVVLNLQWSTLSELPLRPGQTVAGYVTAQGDSLQLGAQRVPLEPGGGLLPNQRVFAELLQTAEGLRLRITPQASGRAAPAPQSPPSGNPPPAPAAAAAPAPSGVAAVLVRVLDELNALRSVDAAARLVPRDMPPSPAGVRSLLSLFLSRGDLGRQVDGLAALLRQAMGAGALSQRTMADLPVVAQQLTGLTPDNAETVLKSWSRASRLPLEARLAAAVREGGLHPLMEEVHRDVRNFVERLRNDPVFQRFLQSRGDVAVFERFADGIGERLTGSHLQNMRGLEHGYQFFEVPFVGEGPIRHAQIHVFGDGGGRHAFEDSKASIALDVSTAHLGDLWVTISVHPPRCQCEFRATSTEAAELIEAHGPELETRLREVVGEAVVRVSLWDGDRLDQVSKLMHRFAGLDMSA